MEIKIVILWLKSGRYCRWSFNTEKGTKFKIRIIIVNIFMIYLMIILFNFFLSNNISLFIKSKYLNLKSNSYKN